MENGGEGRRSIRRRCKEGPEKKTRSLSLILQKPKVKIPLREVAVVDHLPKIHKVLSSVPTKHTRTPCPVDH